MFRYIIFILLICCIVTTASAKKKWHDWTINFNDSIEDLQSARLLTDKKYQAYLLPHIQQARKSIWASSFAFKVTDKSGNAIRKLIKYLIAKAKQGVEVHLVLEQSNYHTNISTKNHQLAKQLRSNNIQVYFDSLENTQHSKVFVIDERYSFIGSHNMTHSAFTRNHEISVMIESRQLSLKIINYLKRISQESR